MNKKSRYYFTIASFMAASLMGFTGVPSDDSSQFINILFAVNETLHVLFVVAIPWSVWVALSEMMVINDSDNAD